ncbi:FUSC family protein [Undibacterium arcticum]
MPGMPDEAVIVLRTSYNKVREVVDMIGQLHLASQTAVAPLPVLPHADMTPFLTQQKYELGLLIASLNLRSSVFRFALRVAMAISVGLLVAEHLPYASHGYWIVLTIVIILKPSYSMTKQRRGDRLLGTTIGCALTALILHLVHAPLALLGFLFLATVAVPSFVYIKYRYTAIAASMQILLQINLMIPNSTGVIGERLLDTLIGAVIATAFSFVLPSWEYRALPRLIKSVLQANRRYIEATRDLLQSGGRDDLLYRLCRKTLHGLRRRPVGDAGADAR